MKVKIGNEIYDAKDQPIMVILNEDEKQQLIGMPTAATKFCQYPNADVWKADDHKKIREFMETDEDEKSETLMEAGNG